MNKAILQGWGIETVADCQALQENIAKITLADGRQFLFKHLGPNAENLIQRLQFEYDVLSHVTEQGLAVAVPLLSRAGVPYVIDNEQVYRLSHWLPNQPGTPQSEADLIRLYRNYGAALGRFHQALASYTDAALLSRTWQTTLQKRVLEEAVPSIQARLDQARLPTFQALLAEVEPGLKAAYADLPTQLIIWDCHPGNVAVAGFEVSGFIDCDHISIAPRVFDLADFLVHLIKWQVGNRQRSNSGWLIFRNS